MRKPSNEGLTGNDVRLTVHVRYIANWTALPLTHLPTNYFLKFFSKFTPRRYQGNIIHNDKHMRTT